MNIHPMNLMSEGTQVAVPGFDPECVCLLNPYIFQAKEPTAPLVCACVCTNTQLLR